MQYTIKRTKSGDSRIDIQGDLLLKSSLEFRKQLQKLAKGSSQITISLKGLTGMDVTAVQLLYSFREYVSSLNIKVLVEMPESDSLLMTLKNSGTYEIIKGKDA